MKNDNAIIPYSTMKQWAILGAVMVVAALAFMVLAGDEDPYNPMTLGTFLLVKGAALLVLIICWRVLVWLHRKGLIPDPKEE